MVFIVAAVYFLLSCPVTVRVAAGIDDLSGSALMEISYLCLCVRYDGVLKAQEGKTLPRMTARYAGKKETDKTTKKGEAADAGRGRKTLRRIRRCMELLNLAGCGGEIALDLLIGTGDAAQTALAAGACRAALPGLLSGLARRAERTVRIMPTYAGPCLTACLRGIFSLPAGDIMLAAVKAAMTKKRKEGAVWKSIPLKA